jgi:molybdopterin/thiamine biosynthesis adenylyltransferase
MSANDRPSDLRGIDPHERERYAWQLDVPKFGEEAQLKLKRATVLITRVGGVGGTVAYELAAAGVGRLILAHAGNLRLDDLNRQLLMTSDWIGRPRVECAARRLRELNPNVEVIQVGENAADENAARLIAGADIVVDAAPLFAERYALNRACVAARKPLVETAMFALELHLTTILPGRTPCLECIYPANPGWWRRRFPVLGAVAGTAGCLAAVEVIKTLTGCGDPLAGRMLIADLGANAFRTVRVRRQPACPVCGQVA